MTLEFFYTLSATMQRVIKRKANETEKDLKDYLENMKDNYCLLTKETGFILAWDKKYDYIVYGSTVSALEDAEEGDNIISEELAVRMLDYVIKLKEKIVKNVGNIL